MKTTEKQVLYSVRWHRDGEDVGTIATGLTLAEAQERIAKEVGAKEYTDAGFGGMNESDEPGCGYYYLDSE